MNWIEQKLPLILAVATAIGLIWRTAMDYAKTEQTRKDVEGLRRTVDIHLGDRGQHLDPIRDERRLAMIEKAIGELGERFDERIERLLNIVMEIRSKTKSL